MITKSNSPRLLLALAAALVAAPLAAAPLAAQDPMTVRGQPVHQEVVSYADLDLRQWSAQQTLKRRVFRAADKVCAQAEGPLADSSLGYGSWYLSAPSCNELTYRHARPQIASAVQRAKTGQQLAAAAFVISARSASR